ncbi:NAD(P)-dependent oxidoreductase [Microbulbifer sp. ALW1]|uniref:NAD(P)-dependent oxidoreductase n=1 Tax=Microbulbifer sp. (strain ALW1) TaxID=1516059 RepID=UPI00135B0D13|nr:NAD(P)H-binding protein [Microbulbifer sp. ALW1]
MENPGQSAAVAADEAAEERCHLIILGASGRTGLHLVQLALEKGYRVTACARQPQKIPSEHPNLVKVAVEINDPDSLQQVMNRSRGIVVSTLGIFHKSEATPLADATLNILLAMKTAGLRRLVLMSSLGVGDSKGQGNWVVAAVSRVILPYVLKDKERQEQRVRESGVDWTVLRPPQLLDSNRSSPYVRWSGAQPNRRLKWKITTRDAADALLTLVREPDSIGRAYQISY